ncbi:DUF397 domain-containing protein [Streptomyces sp. SM12]|uniref:DUF397 domain-containing protein n=1 Tax=Streptomyces sp. SM12 TaxID=1071602 RepID=UPI0027E458C1|nr:DUF397 domain-containing protein [Streptomyces sp. SM12]
MSLISALAVEFDRKQRMTTTMRYDLPTDRWRKSSYSDGGSGSCVEVQVTHDGNLAVGDSKDRALGAFVFPLSAWEPFVSTVKASTSSRPALGR